jgi:Cu+-exporting ATPase
MLAPAERPRRPEDERSATPVTNAREIVERYLGAFWGGDSATARRYLADDLSFAGPAATISGADAYLRASEHARRGARGVETRQVFTDGQDVCVLYELLLDGPVSSVAVAEWYRLDVDRIASIRTILDTAPLTAAAREQPRERSGQTALDPVCHMTVEKGSAAATRRHGGTTYSFCSAGCAAAFEAEPERYLAASRR